jgi:hypothetical protein
VLAGQALNCLTPSCSLRTQQSLDTQYIVSGTDSVTVTKTVPILKERQSGGDQFFQNQLLYFRACLLL